MRMSPAIIVNVATVLAFVGIGAFCVKEGYLPRASRASERRESQLVAGKQLPLFAKYEWHSHKQTLLLMLRKGCHYCEDSAPFYRTLTGLESSGAIKNAHILALFPDTNDVVSKVLESEQLNVESISSVDFGALGVTGTPTAVLVDQAGKILNVWVGELNNSGQQIVLDKLRSGAVL